MSGQLTDFVSLKSTTFNDYEYTLINKQPAGWSSGKNVGLAAGRSRVLAPVAPHQRRFKSGNGFSSLDAQH